MGFSFPISPEDFFGTFLNNFILSLDFGHTRRFRGFNQSRELGLMSLVGGTAFNATQMPNFTPGSLLNVLNKEPQEHNQLIR